MVKTLRKYFYSIYQAYSLAKNDTGNPPKNWHTKQSKGGVYSWVLDVPEVMERYNTSYSTVIKTSPIKALQQDNVNWKELRERILTVAKKKYKNVSLQRRLPGFSPREPIKEGDFVRLREFKSGGTKTLKWPKDTKSKTKSVSSKAAAENWSSEIFEVTKLNLVKYTDGITYFVRNINPKGRPAPKGALDRTEVLKISPETLISDGVATAFGSGPNGGISILDYLAQLKAEKKTEEGPDPFLKRIDLISTGKKMTQEEIDADTINFEDP
jgi:hypothetical protein